MHRDQRNKYHDLPCHNLIPEIITMLVPSNQMPNYINAHANKNLKINSSCAEIIPCTESWNKLLEIPVTS